MIEVQRLATSIVQTLTDAGHTAYFAGGWVRDLIMDHPSDDIDIATTASTEEINALFPKTLQIGEAFGVVVVILEGHPFEVATFREDIDYIDGRKPSRINPASPEEDAKRRDFTINGMFFDPLTDTIIDYVGGRADIEHQVIRTIGHPFERFSEDRLRMIRAIRFACRFSFHLDPETSAAIDGASETLFPAVSMERIWQELVKMHRYPQFDHALVEMHRLNLLPVIFSDLKGVHLSEIKERLRAFPRMPKEAPTLAFILQLFPEATSEKVEEIGRYLRAPGKEIRFTQHLLRCEKLPALTKYEWAKLYALADTALVLQVLAAKMPAEEAKAFLAEHEERQKKLAKHSARLAQKKTLVSSQTLRNEGIKPGKEMGELLRRGEEIAVEHDLSCPDEVLKKLKEGR